MKEKVYEYCLMVISTAPSGQGLAFQPPKGWGNMPIEMWPVEEPVQLEGAAMLQFGLKVVRRPAVLTIWRREIPSPDGAGDDPEPIKHDS